MPFNLSPAEFYRREADRLRSMAESPIFYDVREDLLRMAGEYDILAGQRERLDRHCFGRAFEPSGQTESCLTLKSREDAAAGRDRTG